MASLEYVWWIEEILELDYGMFQTIVFLCNWVVANYGGSNAIVKRDEYEFTLVNFECFIPLSAQSFAFPMHVQQVFFVDDTRGLRGWKVVLCKEPRGQRIQFTQGGNPKLTLFDLGNNSYHVDLRMIDHSQANVTPIPLPNVDVLVGQLITSTQVLVEEMAIASEHDNDEINEQEPLSSKFEHEWLLSIERIIGFSMFNFV
jgi:hypothetical protein